jgi:quercetin dioxygenase-like cupin family protein
MKAKVLKDDEGTLRQVLGSVATVKVDADETGDALEIIVIDAPRGGDVVPHRHPWAETYYVLEGEMTVQVGARTNVLRTGDFATIPARASHGFRVESDHVRFLHVSIGRGASELFAAFDENFPGGPTADDLPRLLEVAEQFGLELVLPTEA